MRPGEDVLERNLELLFTRAYEPVEPSAVFRERLLRALETEMALAGRQRPIAAWRIAAGFLLFLGAALLGWALFVRSDAPRDVHELLVDGQSPPREAPAGEGHSSSGDEFHGGTTPTDPSLDVSPQGSHGRTEASVTTSPDAGPERGPERGSGGEPPLPAVHADQLATLHGTVILPPAPVHSHGGTKPAEFVVTLLRSVRLPAVSQPRSRSFPLETGEFVLDDLKAGTWAVFVHVEGFAISVTRGLELSAGATTELRVELDPGVALRGRVVDAEGRPVEGAQVLAEEETPTQVLPFDPEQVAVLSPATAKSDLNGAFVLGHVGPGKKILRATCSGHGAGWTQKIDPSAPPTPSTVDPSDGVEIRLTRPGAIEGRVVRNDGMPWPGAMVVAGLLDPTYERPCMSFGSAASDAEGRYAIANLPPGAYVVLNVQEANPGIRQVQVGAGQRVTVDLPGTLKGTSLEGTLVASDGRPLSGYDVTLVACAGPKQQEGEWKAVRSDAEGRFHFPDLTPGIHDVFVGGNLGIQFTRLGEIDVPAVPVFRPTIRAGTGFLRGKVSDARTGTALPGSVVVLEIEAEGAFEFAGKTMADGQGAYAIDLLPAGRYRAIAYATIGRYGQETSPEIVIGEGVPASVRDFSLQPGAELTVRVTDSSGRPVQGANVRFVDASGTAVNFSSSDLTDGSGVLHARSMKPGLWIVGASREPEGRASATAELSADEERTLELVLTSDK